MRLEISARPADGFTLMELLMGLVILAILLAGAVPAFQTFTQNNRLDGQANDIVAAAQLARSEALKRGVPVAMCSSADAATCGGTFNSGWIVIANPGTIDQALIQVWPSPGADLQFTPNNGTVTFAPSGFSATNAAQTFDLVLPKCSNNAARRILVERTGRVASQRIACP